MSDWDDLFAKAAGQHDHEEEAPVVPTLPKQKKRKRKRAAKQDERFDHVLEGRRTVPGPDTTWPKWTRLGESLKGSTTCACWNESFVNGKLQCASCQDNPMLHKLQVVVSNESSPTWPLQMFCVIRNLRCMGGLVAMEQVPVDKLKASAASEARILHQVMQKSSLSLPAGEAELLTQKCQTVFNTVNALLNRAKTKDIKSSNDAESVSLLFPEAVRVMIACDHAYYRLYYLQISQILPCHANEVLLHPAEYFHLPFMAWEGMENGNVVHSWEELLQSIVGEANNKGNEQMIDKLKEEWTARYGVDVTNTNETLKFNDVLSYLHRNRTMETTRLFSKWMKSSRAKQEMLTELNKPMNGNGLSRHETPVPSILSEWRDSCRDMLCNLYAYATLSSGTTQRIKNSLKSAGISGRIIEIGAGTGYIASLLKDAGINIVAWDICPPGSSKSNEYHGGTPEFCKVAKGDPSDLRLRFPSLKAEANEALLLCYPPPESTMAKRALEAYLAGGGKCLIHIGEFCGLTGSADFEDLLVRHFHCVDRIPCLAWGTDASMVTVWLRDCTIQERLEQRLLVPCSACGKSESSRQCRVVRHLAYCSPECFRKKSTQISIAMHLAMNMIPLQMESLSYNDDCHFMPIRTSTTTMPVKP